MGRYLIHVIGWLPAAFLAWLAAPFLVPEGLRAMSLGLYLLYGLRAGIVVATMALALRTTQAAASGVQASWWRILVVGLLFLGGLLLSFLWATLLPTRDLLRRCHAGRIGGAVCERYSAGFSPDIPFYRVQRGPAAPGPCPTTTTATLSWDFGQKTQALHPVPCPEGVEGGICFAGRWAGASSASYLGMVAFDPGCTEGIELYGRGPVVEARRERLEGW